MKHGDLYVAMRLKDLYIPMPFADHYFAPDLCKPEIWCEIDFPKGLTGHTRVATEEMKGKILTLAEAERSFLKFLILCKYINWLNRQVKKALGKKEKDEC